MSLFTKMLCVCAGIVLAGPIFADDDDRRDQKQGRVLKVDCNKGKTITKALKRARPGDTVKISGFCNERITITQGPLTIEGRTGAVLDGTSVPPKDVEFNGLVTVDGATGVVIRGLTIQNSRAEGVLGIRRAGLVLENVIIKEHRRGILLSEASAEIGGVTIRGGAVGLQVTAGASVTVTGDVDVSMTENEAFSLLGGWGEIRGGNISIHDNVQLSVVVVAGSTLTILGFEKSSRSSLSVTSNSGPGILLGNGTLEIGGVTPTSPLIESSGNGGPGIILTAGGTLLNAAGWGRIVLERNPVGIDASVGSTLSVRGGLEVRDNFAAGLVASDVSVLLSPGINPVSIESNGDGSDVVLQFGARSTIDAGVTIGSPLICDGTVLSQGTTVCP